MCSHWCGSSQLAQSCPGAPWRLQGLSFGVLGRGNPLKVLALILLDSSRNLHVADVNLSIQGPSELSVTLLKFLFRE